MTVYERYGRHDHAGYQESPFFLSPVLNRSIIVKHRLRQDELETFGGTRGEATKIILPIDPTNMKSGGRSFFIHQRGYDDLLSEVSSSRPDASRRDRALLEVLDELPSLDPFLMRERLRRAGFAPDRCYFELSEADHAKIFDFLQQELAPLIGLTFDAGDTRLGDKTGKLATKVLSNVGAAELEPLRIGMGMGVGEFQEGMFCWMGFMYYKWSLNDIVPKVKPAAAQIELVKPFGPSDPEEREYIFNTRKEIALELGRACEAVRATLRIYDQAYESLTSKGRPEEFREFLRRAPSLFVDLGQKLGAVHHIVSFWRFRFPNGNRSRIGAQELVDLLADFESNLILSEDAA